MCQASDRDSKPQTLIRETSSAAETEALAAQLARGLVHGDVVLLEGELGSGKTTFVRGVVRALGITDPVNSPTFSIGHRYIGKRVNVSHLDLYRIQALTPQEQTLIEDYLTGEEIALVEWPEVADGRLPRPCVRISLTHLGEDRRRIEVESL